MADPEEAAAAGTDYLRLLGLVAIAFVFAKSARIAGEQIAAGADDDGFYAAKLVTVGFFYDRILPQVAGLLGAITSGKKTMMALEIDAF